MFADAVGSGREIKNDRLKLALQEIETRIQDFLTNGAARNYSLEDVLDLANQHAALLTIYDEVARLRAIILWRIYLCRETRQAVIKSLNSVGQR